MSTLGIDKSDIVAAFLDIAQVGTSIILNTLKKLWILEIRQSIICWPIQHIFSPVNGRIEPSIHGCWKLFGQLLLVPVLAILIIVISSNVLFLNISNGGNLLVKKSDNISSLYQHVVDTFGWGTFIDNPRPVRKSVQFCHDQVTNFELPTSASESDAHLLLFHSVVPVSLLMFF